MRFTLSTLVLVLILPSFGSAHPREVTATAYNSVKSQTAGDPTLTAWGDTLKPGMKAIAVSRDLIEDGLTHGTKVTIEGLPGTYVVRDKMNKRWKNKIDIYMGKDVEAAREWGKQTVTISW
ncbi:3D domain-containing protein [Marinobacter salicampi]|uniref:3D domain-containing protein n=1 Tax=Marinobacter salicampi TaxID=435907 RepID=UPI001F5F5DB6|nr:3D domain-containing protein [Marinobacter salicampi]